MSMSEAAPRATPLRAVHEGLGATMTAFAGWLMPLRYAGEISEHQAVRNAAGLFDLSHMGEIAVTGPQAPAALDYALVGRLSALAPGRARYTMICAPDGGILDDLIVYRLAEAEYLVVANAANTATVAAALHDRAAGHDAQVRDQTAEYALIAIQGPHAARILAPLADIDLDGVKYYSGYRCSVAGQPVLLARTGYTGEDGFEVFCAGQDALPVWDALLEATDTTAGGPAGLGARDTLRLEARLYLYGNDLSDETTPLEAGLDWVVRFAAGDFIGKEALLRQRESGVTRRLVGFVMHGRGIPRHGYGLHAPSGEKIGEVTSGGVGPTVGENIGLGYVPAALAAPGGSLVVDCRGKMIEAKIHKGPFYRRTAS